MKGKWTSSLPADVYERLCACRNVKSDVETLVNVRWAWIKAKGTQEDGFVKEDALVYILELLDCNGQYLDLTREEYDELVAE